VFDKGFKYFVFEYVGDDCTPDDYSSMALHFEQKKQHFLAGKFFSKAGQYSKVSHGVVILLCETQFII
jgi:hypothetical protein